MPPARRVDTLRDLPMTDDQSYWRLSNDRPNSLDFLVSVW